METVNMYEKYGEIINIRSNAEHIFDNISPEVKEVTVDFKNINFIGRSFTQEYFRQVKKNKFIIHEINKNEDVDMMIKAVFKE